MPRRPVTTRWRFQAAVVIGVYEIYRFARIAVRGSPPESLRHALQLVRVERWMHLYVERGTQDLLVDMKH